MSTGLIHFTAVSMHEVGIMEEAVRLAVETARQSGADRIRGMRLRVGTLSGVVPDALRFAFEVACQEPMLRGAWLRIESITPSCWCAACQAEFETPDWIGECPSCHAVSHELRRGRELEIASVELC